MTVYNAETASEAVINGLEDLRRAREKADHYRNGPTPPHIVDDLNAALRQVAEGLDYVREQAEAD